MKRKTAYGIFIAAFFILCLIPSAGMLLFGESEAAANEILSPRPVIFQEDGSFNQNFTDDLTSYIADRFAFRRSSSQPTRRFRLHSLKNPPRGMWFSERTDGCFIRIRWMTICITMRSAAGRFRESPGLFP